MRAGAFRGGKEVTPEEFLNALTDAVVETVRNYNEKKSMKEFQDEPTEAGAANTSSVNPSTSHATKQHGQQR